MVKTNEEKLNSFRINFGKLVGNCDAFNIMIDMLSNLEDKRILYYIIEKFWFIEHQRCKYYKLLPKQVKSYYSPFFIKNMFTIMQIAISRCGRMDCTANLRDEDGNWLYADDCEIAYQFNKSNLYKFIYNVLSTYCKINCK